MNQLFTYKLKFSKGNNTRETFVIQSEPVKGIIGPDGFKKLLLTGVEKEGRFLESWRSLVKPVKQRK